MVPRLGCSLLSKSRNCLFMRGLSLEVYNFGRSTQPSPPGHSFFKKRDKVTSCLTKEHHFQRRQNFVKLIQDEEAASDAKPGSHLIIFLSAAVAYMSQDIPYPFHQNTDFSYLTGFQEADSCLVMEVSPDLCPQNHRSTLFVQKRDKIEELWNGPRASTDGVLKHTGVDRVEDVGQLGQFLRNRMSQDTTVWYDYEKVANMQIHMACMRGFLHDACKKNIGVRRARGLLYELRLIKSTEECDLMTNSCNVISEAFKDTMVHSKPGMNESQLHATLGYAAAMKGAEMLAFPPVVASGNRANTLHYISNNQTIEDGSLVLVDAGALCSGYVSDVTRTWPINGRFSETQKILYEAVLRMELLCINLCRPGNSLDDIHRVMATTMGQELYNIGLLKRTITTAECMELVRELCPHHVGHWLGMDVHDTPSIQRSVKLSPGMVVTIEPGIYIREDNSKFDSEFRGIGIRIEDDVLVTNGDPVVLTSKCPKTVEEIESVMNG